MLIQKSNPSTLSAPAVQSRALLKAPLGTTNGSADTVDVPSFHEKSRIETLASGAVTVGTTASAMLKAFPGFIYPSIHNASAAEHAQIVSVLDKLPLKHVSEVANISMVSELSTDKPNSVILGRAYDYGSSNQIQLSRKQLTTPDRFESTLVHEIGHTTDYSNKPFRPLPTTGGASSHRPYGEGPHISEYSKTNPREDFAETYEEFHRNPEHLNEVAPEKYQDMERQNQQSFTEKLVDRKEFRETGKFIGEKIGPNQPTRHFLEAATYATSVIQVGQGLNQWIGSAKTGDKLAHASGILTTASGAILASGVSPIAGLGVQAANLALKRAVKRGDLTANEVESTVALGVRPLEAMFGRESSPILKAHRPGKVLAVATGGAVGGTVGSMAGPYLGVLAGYNLGGGMGGAIGLALGGVAGFLGGTEIGGRVGGALAELVSR